MSTMTIRICPGNLKSSTALAARVARSLHRSLRRFAPRVTRVEVHFADLRRAGAGRADMRCTMEARLVGRKPIAVEHRAGDLYAAIGGAARKLRTALTRSVDRTDSRGQRRARRLLHSADAANASTHGEARDRREA